MGVTSVVIRDMRNNSFMIMVDENMTVRQVKQTITKNSPNFTDINQMALMFNGVELENDSTLGQVGVKNNDVLDVVSTFLGGNL